MRKFIAACILIAISSVALSIYGQARIDKCADNKVEVAGVIRSKDENGWFVINDGRHTPLNIDRVEVKQGYIIIHFTFTAATIHSFIVSADETFSRDGFFFGACVYSNWAGIAVSRIIDGKVVPVDASTIRSKVSNLWIYGLFSVDEQDG